MSGGHFDYNQYHIEDIAEQLEKEIADIEYEKKIVRECETEEWADDHWHFEIEDPEVLEEFKRGLKILKMAAIYAQRIDWLMSGDDGEESFKRRLKEELDELDSKPLIDYERWQRYREENN